MKPKTIKPIYETGEGDSSAGTSQAGGVTQSAQAGKSWGKTLGVLSVVLVAGAAGFISAFPGLWDRSPKPAISPVGTRESSRTFGVEGLPPDGSKQDPPASADRAPRPDLAAGGAEGGSSAPLASPPPLSVRMPPDSLSTIEEGKQVALHLVETFPESLDALEMRARFDYGFGSVEIAKELWTRIIEDNPSYVFALRGLGDVATVQGELAEAVKFYRRAVVLNPNNISMQVVLGIALLHNSQLEESRQVFEALLAREPNHIGAHVELGSVLVQLQQYEAAREHFEIALEVTPEQAEIHFGLANVYARLGNQEKSRHHREEHRRFQASVVTERESGRRNYDDLAAIRIDVARHYVDMARVYLAGGQIKSAELLLTRAARMNPSDVDSRQALAYFGANQGKSHEAIRWLREVAALQPEQFSYPQEIARLYLAVGQVADAEKTILEFIERQGENPAALGAAAEFYQLAVPDPEKAVRYGRALTELEPTAESWAELAGIHEFALQLDEAIQAMQRAVELDPTNSTYLQVLALLKEHQLTDAREPQ